MKLKKIASLALAGVMAVSMLTACQTTSNNGNNGGENGTNPPVQTSGLSAAVEARLSKDLLDYVTLKDSTELDADLEYAVEYVGVREIVDGFVNVNDLLLSVESPNFNAALETEVGVNNMMGTGTQYTVYNIGDNRTLVNDEKASEQSTTMRDAVAVESYVISGQIGDRAVQQKIADEIASYIYDYQYVVNENGSVNPITGKNEYSGGSWNHEYTVSISACTVDTHSVVVENNFGKWDGIIGAENPDVTYVAVQVVRNSTHQ